MVMPKLTRSIGWKTYGLFGLGNIVGAGIYVLIGEVAAVAGTGLIWTFVVAGLVASLTVYSYGALASKYPRSAGASVYVLKSFNARTLSLIVGLVLAFSGIVSGGVLLNGFANYAFELSGIPTTYFIVAAVLVLAAVTLRGIKESITLAVIITLIEVTGLLLVSAAAFMSPSFTDNAKTALSTSLQPGILPIMAGSFLAFYAFIGFEDMVNVAEEVRNPSVNVKKAMYFAIIAAIALYTLVAVAALSVLSASELGESKAPLAAVYKTATGYGFPLVTYIGLFAIVNGVIAQIIMGSRVLYGLSSQKLLPAWFGVVGKKTHTPTNATLLIVVVMLAAALSLPLATLAGLTSLALLVIFTIVHAACIKLRHQLNINPFLPSLGIALNLIVIAFQLIG